MKAAIASRDMIGMAKGVIMARQGCSPDEAFDVLRRASQRANQKLAHIAAGIVDLNARAARGSPGLVGSRSGAATRVR